MILDLAHGYREVIEKILKKHIPEVEVWAFGSRVRWTAKDSSDLDLVSDKKTPSRVLTLLNLDFTESNLPFKVDILDWQSLSEEFQKIIREEYVLFKKENFPLSFLFIEHHFLTSGDKNFLNLSILVSKKLELLMVRRKNLKGKIDIAMMQTLSKMDEGDLKRLLNRYEQIIVDECHHIAAFTFESILKNSPARYVLGLTATPYRKDGHQAIIHMQSGPIRYEMSGEEIEFDSKRVIVRNSDFKLPDETGPQPSIHQIWSHLINDKERLDLVSDDIIDNLDETRVPLVISERKEHLQLLRKNLVSKNVSKNHVFILDGDLSKNQRSLILDEINAAIDRKDTACILTTGSFIGEGFDLPALDTLFLTMPVAFRGRIIQYAGRIHRPVKGKNESEFMITLICV